MIDPPLPCPARDRHQAAIDFSRKCVERADQKLIAARAELARARNQLGADERALADWLAANPSEQPDLELGGAAA